MLNNNLNLEMLINIMDDDLFDNLLKNSKNGYYNDIPLVIFIQTEKQAEYYIQNYGKIIEIDLIIDNKEILKNLNVKNFQILIEFFLEDFLEKEILIKELLENLQNKECPEVKKLAYQYINKYNLDEANIFMNWRKSKLINEIDKETKNFKDNGIDYIWLIGIAKKDNKVMDENCKKSVYNLFIKEKDENKDKLLNTLLKVSMIDTETLLKLFKNEILDINLLSKVNSYDDSNLNKNPFIFNIILGSILKIEDFLSIKKIDLEAYHKDGSHILTFNKMFATNIIESAKITKELYNKKDKNGLTLFECYISKDINREPVNTQKIQKILEDNIEELLSFSESSNKTLLNILTKNYPLMTLSLIKKNLINPREDKVRKEIEKALVSKMNVNNSLIEEELLKQHLIKIDKEILSEGIKNIDNNFKKNRL